MKKLEEEIKRGTYSFTKLEKWIKRQINTFNTLLPKTKTVKKIASLADLDTLLIPINQN